MTNEQVTIVGLGGTGGHVLPALRKRLSSAKSGATPSVTYLYLDTDPGSPTLQDFTSGEVIRLHHGILNIRSGGGKLLVHNDKEYLYQPRGLYRAPMYFWGTQIGVVLHRA